MDRFEHALASAIDALEGEFGDKLVGLLVAGSVVYGVPMQNSDIDLYVLIDGDWRQRRNRVIEGVEVEMFVNPVAKIYEELEEGCVPTVDMFARGRIVRDTDGVVAALVEQAKRAAVTDMGQPDGTAVYFARYVPSDLVRDVEDLLEIDLAAATLLLHTALTATMEAQWTIRGQSPPKPKRLLSRFRDDASQFVSLVEAILDGERELHERIERLRELCDGVLSPVGGLMLEGETEPERCNQPGQP